MIVREGRAWAENHQRCERMPTFNLRQQRYNPTSFYFHRPVRPFFALGFREEPWILFCGGNHDRHLSQGACHACTNTALRQPLF
jgi:hypothetical protein